MLQSHHDLNRLLEGCVRVSEGRFSMKKIKWGDRFPTDHFRRFVKKIKLNLESKFLVKYAYVKDGLFFKNILMLLIILK